MPLREGKIFFFGRAEESWYFYGENGVSCLKRFKVLQEERMMKSNFRKKEER